jgi:hypothetical protein
VSASSEMDTKQTTVVQANPHRDPAPVDDHDFVPRGEWWSLCESCGLAQPAHLSKKERP